ncbi:MAG TPA: hypothetical protein VH575_04330 [Gemmataceae bacterium]
MAQAVVVPTPLRTDFTGASPSRSTIDEYKRFMADLAEHPPSPIPLFPSVGDFEGRRDHLSAVLAAISRYLNTALEDVAANVPGSLDLAAIEALRADLISEILGTVQKATSLIDAGGGR